LIAAASCVQKPLLAVLHPQIFVNKKSGSGRAQLTNAIDPASERAARKLDGMTTAPYTTERT